MKPCYTLRVKDAPDPTLDPLAANTTNSSPSYRDVFTN